MSTHPLRFAALAAALLAFGVSLSAQEPGCGFGPGQGRGPMGQGHGRMGEGRGMRGLHLTEVQQTKMKAIHESHQAAFKAKGEAAGSAHKALREAMANDATDAKALKTLHDKVATAQFELVLEHRALRQEVLPLLTPEQKAQFDQHPMGMGMGSRSGRGMGHDSGRGMGPGAGRGMGPGSGPGMHTD